MSKPRYPPTTIVPVRRETMARLLSDIRVIMRAGGFDHGVVGVMNGVRFIELPPPRAPAAATCAIRHRSGICQIRPKALSAWPKSPYVRRAEMNRAYQERMEREA